MTLQTPEYWQTLRLVNLFRLLLGLAFGSLYFLPVHSTWVDQSFVSLFSKISLVYILIAVVFILLWFFREPDFFKQLFWQLVFDILFINLFIFATGKSGDEISMLLIIPITISAYLMPQIYAFFFAAFASLTLSVFTFVYYGNSPNVLDSYFEHGILGAVLFSAALVFSRIAMWTHKNELKAEQQRIDLKNLEEINNKIINRLNAGIVIVDQKLQIKHINQSAIDYLNLGTSPLRKNLYYSAGKLAIALKSWQNHPYNQPFIFQQGEESPKLRATMEPFGNNWIMVVLEKLSVINEELQQLKLSSLGRLTASIAHEIRNPLSAIKQATQLLEEQQAERGEQKLIHIIENNVQRMNAIVDKIMQLSKKQHFHPETIKLNEFLQLFVYEFCMVEGFNQENITITMDQDNLEIYFDATHLNQILWNLFNNSIKHSQQSKSSLKINIKATSISANRIEIRYCDNGVTIAAEQVESLFEPFYTSSSTGTGLGLYICKELCNLNQAEMIYVPATKGNCFKMNAQASKT